jgi:translation initiation factor 2 subunit 3
MSEQKVTETSFLYDLNKIMYNQPTTNVGMLGHVADGKSTLIRALTGALTQRYAKEKERGITIKVGYANAKIWMCPTCGTFQATSSAEITHNCTTGDCCGECVLRNHISFVDNPGHHAFMQTMMSGTKAMDFAILVESAENPTIPAPQTREHLEIVQYAQIPVPIVCMNKCDLKKQHEAEAIISTFRSYLDTTSVNPTVPILPISATLGINTDVLCQMLAELPVPVRDLDSPFKMLVIRSFNANKPRTPIHDIKGGVIGGSLARGVIRPGTNVMLYPGIVSKGKDNIWRYMPLRCKTLSIKSDDTELEFAITGGLIGVQLDIDPSLTCDDGLVGQMMYPKSVLDVNVYDTIIVLYTQIVGIDSTCKLSVNINSNNINCTVDLIADNMYTLKLEKPVCAEVGDIVTVSKVTPSKAITIVGFGTVQGGVTCRIVRTR